MSIEEKSEKYKKAEKEATEAIVALTMSFFVLLGFYINSTISSILDIAYYDVFSFMGILILYIIWCKRFINKEKNIVINTNKENFNTKINNDKKGGEK